MTTRLLWMVVLVAFVTGGCQELDWEEYSEVTKLRILAVRAEPPEIGPGQVATVDALVTNPQGAPIALAWELCFVTEGPDEEYACLLDSESGETLGVPLGQGDSVQVPYDLVDAAAGDLEAICDELLQAEVPEFVQLPDCERGLEVTIRLTATSGDDREVGVKGLLLLLEDEAARDDVNVNPTIDGLLVDNTSASAGPVEIDVVAGEPVRLQALVNSDEAQQYEAPDPDEEGARLDAENEVLSIAWFATHGRYDRQTTYFQDEVVEGAEFQNNTLNLLKGGTPAEVGDTVTVWVVVRDDRGGVDYASWTLDVVSITE